MNSLSKASAALFILLLTCSAGAGLKIVPDDAEVVIDLKAPSITRFAADEMTNFLSRVLNCHVPVVTEPSGHRISIILGTNAWSTLAGIDTSRLKRDGFILRTDISSRRLYITGNDAPAFPLQKLLNNGEKPHGWGKEDSEQGTLNGVYDFLERFANCRFYFPGEMGTLVPSADKIDVPAGEIRSEPDWRVRVLFSDEFHTWYEQLSDADYNRVTRLEQLRLRMSSANPWCCHGQFRMNYAKRFATTHPEYFSLTEDGTRLTNATRRARLNECQHLCQSSRVWDEIYEDAKSYFRGEGPECRGVLSGFDGNARVDWGSYAIARRYFDVSPQDASPLCHCTDCQAAYAKCPDKRCPSTDLIWGRTVETANRLTTAGIRGCLITDANYGYFGGLPSCDMPDNVLAFLGGFGPWLAADPKARDDEYAIVRKWASKLKIPPAMWVFVGKCSTFGLNLPAIPIGTPHAIAEYCQTLAPQTCGIMLQPYSEYFIFHYLDFYIWSKIAWKNSCDVKSVLDDHYVRMFGAGAKDMEMLYDAIEEKWLKVIGRAAPVPWGYGVAHLDTLTIMQDLYSESELSRLNALCNHAISKTGIHSDEAKRIRFICDAFLSPVTKRAAKIRAAADAKKEDTARKSLAPTSLAVHLNCDTMTGWKVSHGGILATDTNTRREGRASIRLTSTNDVPSLIENTAVFFRGNAESPGFRLKPSTRYRFSCFLKTDDIHVVNGWGGLTISLTGAVKSSFTERGEQGGELGGTHDWFSFVREFETPSNLENDAETQLALQYVFAVGTVWLDDVRIDATGPVKSKP